MKEERMKCIKENQVRRKEGQEKKIFRKKRSVGNKDGKKEGKAYKKIRKDGRKGRKE